MEKTITTIAARLTALLQQQQFVEAYEELFDENAVSIDPMYQPDLKGLSGLIEREKLFLSRAEIKKIRLSEPILAGNYFSVSLSMDFSVAGQDKTISELCIYKVENSKIISQQFFISGL